MMCAEANRNAAFYTQCCTPSNFRASNPTAELEQGHPSINRHPNPRSAKTWFACRHIASGPVSLVSGDHVQRFDCHAGWLALDTKHLEVNPDAISTMLPSETGWNTIMSLLMLACSHGIA
jgi:hypothetical protein